jgi:PKHD-type hydroxylase
MLHIPDLLDQAELAEVNQLLATAEWVDGRHTAGHLSMRVKNNHQLAEESAIAEKAGAIVTAALNRNPQFMSATLPARIVPPLFNRYGPGEAYGGHIDGAIRHVNGLRIRTDLSATVFLAAPEDYDGGELCINEEGSTQRVKLAAGDMLLYAATSIHAVEPVTRGARTAAFFWIQSIVRDRVQRQMLFELDQAIQQLTADTPDSAAILPLTGHYHNLVRLWAEG